MFKSLKIIGSAAVLALSTGFAASTGTFAQSATYLDQDSDTCEIFRAMSQEIPEACALEPKTRGLSTFVNQPATDDKTRSVVFEGQQQTTIMQPQPKENTGIAIQVLFEYDSAELTPQAYQLLDQVGTVLANDILQETRFRIEGHADHRGSDSYNMALSEERARSVAAYLVQYHNVDPYRLFIVGKGESEPYDPSNPESAANRRVEFWNIGG